MQVGQKEVFITFRVEKSSYFRRDGADIHTDAFISVTQAILGGGIRVQGVYEDLTLEIPKGTASHTRIRLNGKGLRKVNAYGYGDHYVHIKIKVPVRLTEKQRTLLLAYAELEDDTPGTVNGITYTKDGTVLLFVSFFRINFPRLLRTKLAPAPPEVFYSYFACNSLLAFITFLFDWIECAKGTDGVDSY